MPTAPASPTTDVQTQKPEARLAAIAATADAKAVASYNPTPTDKALAGALFTSGVSSFADLAAQAGISISTLDRVQDDPARAAWIVSHARQIGTLGLTAVYARIFERALKSKSPQWAKLYLELFDETFQKAHAPAAPTTNNQYNFVTSMSDRELRAFIEQKRRAVLGERS